MFTKLEPHTIDLGTLEEIRDPNYINRYPPLYKRKPHLISLIKRRNQSLDSNSDNDIAIGLSEKYPTSRSLTPIPFLLHTASESFHDEIIEGKKTASKQTIEIPKRRNIIRNLLKKFTIRKVKQVPIKPIIRRLSTDPIPGSSTSSIIDMRSIYPTISIISETSSQYLDTLYPTRRSTIKIKQDSPNSKLKTRFHIESRSVNSKSKLTKRKMLPPLSPTAMMIQATSATTNSVSPINSIIIPPVHAEFRTNDNPLEYANSIIHPNLNASDYIIMEDNDQVSIASHSPMHINSPRVQSSLKNRVLEPEEIPFSHYDLHNLYSGGLSPRVGSQHNAIDQQLFSAHEQSEGSDNDDIESYYSFVKSPSNLIQVSPKSPNSLFGNLHFRRS
ncbi:uncharacterized protein RJT21DRAFT_142028 [Scheffersomyces amazonensis]|uniref:uncharacterized protein n=1 Tax=Scheffersomyces amazonensis TaxID=1078765 RepID=UPI00315D3690